MPSPVLERSSYPVVREFLRSQQWFEVICQTSLPVGHVPRIYVYYHSSETPLVALFCCTQPGKRTLFSLTNFYSVDFGPIFLGDPGYAREGLAAIAAYIGAEKPGWQTVELRFLNEEREESQTLVEVLQENGFAVNRFFQYENWYLRTEGRSFSELFSGRPSQLRNTIARKEKKAKKQHAVRVGVWESVSAGLDDAIASFVAIYNSSWKQPEPFSEFIPQLIRVAADLGVLRLGILYVDGTAAAGQLWLVSNRRAVIYKLAYDEAFRDLSAGSILSREMFQHAVQDDRVTEVDYGVGSEPYKRDWMERVRLIYGVEAFNRRTLAGTIRFLAWKLIRSARRLQSRVSLAFSAFSSLLRIT
jgi:hypothetical protein